MFSEQGNIVEKCYDWDDKSLTELANGYFSMQTLQLIDNQINDILNGRTNLHQFDLQEHAGLCTAGAPLIGAYAVCHYARRCLAASGDATARQGSLANWEIDAKQEELVQKWAENKKLWISNSEQWINSTFGPKIAQGAEAKVYYRAGDTSVIKERTSIYAR